MEEITQSKNHNEHWTNTVESLNLRGLLLAGMAVFIAYFTIRQSSQSLPWFFVLNPYLSVMAFAIVVSRVHIMSSIEPDMAQWWDHTIENASKTSRIADYALEGPWLFLLTALPFSCLSITSAAVTFALWCGLESIYLWIGRQALTRSDDNALGPDTTKKVDRYYAVRIQHEITAAILMIIAGGSAVIAKSHPAYSVAILLCWTSLVATLILETAIEVARNPWYHNDLSLPDAKREKPPV